MAADPHTPDDPSWFGPRDLALSLVPWVAIKRAGRARNPLDAIRSLFSVFVMAVVWVGVVVIIVSAVALDDVEPSLSQGAGLGAVMIVGVFALVGQRLLDPPLRCNSEASLVGSYRTRMVIGIAFAEAPALAAFALTFVTGEPWLYLVGLLLSFVGFVHVAPTRTNLEKDQERLNEQGCMVSLVSVLSGGQGML